MLWIDYEQNVQLIETLNAYLSYKYTERMGTFWWVMCIFEWQVTNHRIFKNLYAFYCIISMTFLSHPRFIAAYIFQVSTCNFMLNKTVLSTEYWVLSNILQ